MKAESLVITAISTSTVITTVTTVSSIATTVSPTVSPIATAVSPIATTVSPTVSPIATAVSPIATTVSPTVSPIATAVSPTITDALISSGTTNDVVIDTHTVVELTATSPVATTSPSVSEHIDDDTDSVHSQSSPATSPVFDNDPLFTNEQEIDQQLKANEEIDQQNEEIDQQHEEIDQQEQQAISTNLTTKLEEEDKHKNTLSVTTSQRHLSPRPSPSPLSLTPDMIPENLKYQFAVGQRVLVANTVQGTVRFIGETNFAEGVWIGVELDEGRGKNNGSVNGRTYFSCAPRHGVFAPPSKVVPLVEEDEQEDEKKEEVEQQNEQEEEVEQEDDEEVEEVIEDDSEELSESNEERVSSPSVISPIEDREEELPVSDKDIVVSSSQLKEAKLNDVSQHINNTMVDNLTQHLTDQLTTEAFNVVHELWSSSNTKDKPEISSNKFDNTTIDKLTNDILTDLIQSETQTIRDIKRNKSEGKGRRPSRTSFSSEPLALVPSTQPLVNHIVEFVWNMTNEESHPEPTDELLDEVCIQSSGTMLDCEKSFVYLVFNIATDIIQSHKQCYSHLTPSSSFILKPPSLTLESLQKDVYTRLHCKKSSCLPCVRYIHGNCRPGGKEVDFIDSVLIRELRAEEPSWVDYEREEEIVKEQTSEMILDLLLDETVEVIQRIYFKKKKDTL